MSRETSTLKGHYEPSPSARVREQVALYVAESRWPHFPEYRATAHRDIPILVLEPAPNPESQP